MGQMDLLNREWNGEVIEKGNSSPWWGSIEDELGVEILKPFRRPAAPLRPETTQDSYHPRKKTGLLEIKLRW